MTTHCIHKAHALPMKSRKSFIALGRVVHLTRMRQWGDLHREYGEQVDHRYRLTFRKHPLAPIIDEDRFSPAADCIVPQAVQFPFPCMTPAGKSRKRRHDWIAPAIHPSKWMQKPARYSRRCKDDAGRSVHPTIVWVRGVMRAKDSPVPQVSHEKNAEGLPTHLFTPKVDQGWFTLSLVTNQPTRSTADDTPHC
jgi:hypothetical protein